MEPTSVIFCDIFSETEETDLFQSIIEDLADANAAELR